jgi:hypothetical protein
VADEKISLIRGARSRVHAVSGFVKPILERRVRLA